MKFSFQNDGAPSTGWPAVVEFVRSKYDEGAGGFVDARAANSVVSLESRNLNEGDYAELNRSLDGFSKSLVGLAGAQGMDPSMFNTVAMESAQAALMLTAGARSIASRRFSVSENDNTIVVRNLNRYDDARTEYSNEYRAALEAFDERTNKDMVFYSIVYNMAAARQSEFVEAFYRTIVVPPDQVGFSLAVQLIQVAPDVKHDINGKLMDFKRRNIIDAMIDPTILENDSTRAVPVYKDAVAQFFLPAALYTPVATAVAGVSCLTAPLLFGVENNLITLSGTDELMKAGVFGVGDSIDVREQLEAVYLQVSDGTKNELIRFNVAPLPFSEFNYTPQGQFRKNVLNFETKVLSVNANTKLVSNGVSTLLAPLVSGGYDVRLRLQVNGSSNLESGTTQLFATPTVLIESIRNAAGTLLATTDANYLTIAALFAKSTWVGYDLNARRANLNKRQRGTLVNIDHINYVYQVPLRAPVTMPRPPAGNNAGDASDLTGLIMATNLQTTNSGIDELLKVDGILHDYVNNAAYTGSTVEILGAGSRFVQPTYYRDTVDCVTDIDSLKTADRIVDLQALLVNKIRDMASSLYAKSGYKPALETMRGTGVKPCVIVGTDPYIARYLNITGDMRLLGDQFSVKVVETNNNRITGKIFITFGIADQTAEGVPNVLQFGHCAWKPEMTMIVDMPRDGGLMKEISVAPSYAHITNLPLLGRIDVSNIASVVASKVTVNVSK